ncbi:hypothetical protein D3C86_1088210 [compost metagenome]
MRSTDAERRHSCDLPSQSPARFDQGLRQHVGGRVVGGGHCEPVEDARPGQRAGNRRREQFQGGDRRRPGGCARNPGTRADRVSGIRSPPGSRLCVPLAGHGCDRRSGHRRVERHRPGSRRYTDVFDRDWRCAGRRIPGRRVLVEKHSLPGTVRVRQCGAGRAGL